MSSLRVQGGPKTSRSSAGGSVSRPRPTSLRSCGKTQKTVLELLVEQHRPRVGPLRVRDVASAQELGGGLDRREHPRADQPTTAVGTDAVGGPQALAQAVPRAHPRAVPAVPHPRPGRAARRGGRPRRDRRAGRRGAAAPGREPGRPLRGRGCSRRPPVATAASRPLGSAVAAPRDGSTARSRAGRARPLRGAVPVGPDPHRLGRDAEPVDHDLTVRRTPTEVVGAAVGELDDRRTRGRVRRAEARRRAVAARRQEGDELRVGRARARASTTGAAAFTPYSVESQPGSIVRRRAAGDLETDRGGRDGGAPSRGGADIRHDVVGQVPPQRVVVRLGPRSTGRTPASTRRPRTRRPAGAPRRTPGW